MGLLYAYLASQQTVTLTEKRPWSLSVGVSGLSRIDITAHKANIFS